MSREYLDDIEEHDARPRCDECGSSGKCYLGCSWNPDGPVSDEGDAAIEREVNS